MIINRPGASFAYNGVKYVVGEEIIGTDQSEYRNLLGYITEIRDGEDKETENDTPDIYCSFEPPASPYDIVELEKTFSSLYDAPKKLEDIILDMVIMAPEMITPTRELKSGDHVLTVYAVQQDWAVDGEGGCSTETYLDYQTAKMQFNKALAEEIEQGCIQQWQGQKNFVCDASNDSYEAYLDGEYIENHFSVSISKHSVSLPSTIFGNIGRSYIDECRVEDFIEQIDDWDEINAMSRSQYEKLISDPSIPDRIEKQLGMNDAYWEAYWESVSEVAHKMVHKYTKENQT